MLPRNELLKYLLDIEPIITELEKIIAHHNSDFTSFESNFISIRAVERDLMIIGEAIGKILKIKNEVTITSSKHIIGFESYISMDIIF